VTRRFLSFFRAEAKARLARILRPNLIRQADIPMAAYFFAGRKKTRLRFGF
jgi:hypothetical protein